MPWPRRAGRRRIWYRLDREHFDADTEAALKHDELLQMAGSKFSLHDVVYRGGPAYFFVLSSMMLRIPRMLKPVLAPPMFVAEQMYKRLRGRFWFPYFIARWRRTE